VLPIVGGDDNTALELIFSEEHTLKKSQKNERKRTWKKKPVEFKSFA
jgi:hypothetical protein